MRLPGECKPSAIPGSATQPEGIGALGGNSGGARAGERGGARAGKFRWGRIPTIERGILDGGKDPQVAAAVWTVFNVALEEALEQTRPTHARLASRRAQCELGHGR